ncbi:MAG: hypothetical protein V3W34_09795 [Phycisphaerae bacterium]
MGGLRGRGAYILLAVRPTRRINHARGSKPSRCVRRFGLVMCKSGRRATARQADRPWLRNTYRRGHARTDVEPVAADFVQDGGGDGGHGAIIGDG